jgi:hypothetical protein
MTYFLMCNMAYLILGVLYAWWRIVWQFLVTLLYTVACLDRSLLPIMKLLDAPYIGFVASVKLEQAWRKLSEGAEEGKEGEEGTAGGAGDGLGGPGRDEEEGGWRGEQPESRRQSLEWQEQERGLGWAGP